MDAAEQDTVVLAPAPPPPPRHRRRLNRETTLALGLALVLLLVSLTVIHRPSDRPATSSGAALPLARSISGGRPVVAGGAGALVFATDVRNDPGVSTALFPVPPQQLWRLSLEDGTLRAGPVILGSLAPQLQGTPGRRVAFIVSSGSGQFLETVDARGATLAGPAIPLAPADLYSPAQDGRLAYAGITRAVGFQGSVFPPAGRLEVGVVAPQTGLQHPQYVREGRVPELSAVALLDGIVYLAGRDRKGVFIQRLDDDRLVDVLRGWVVDSVIPPASGFLVHRDRGPSPAAFRPFVWRPGHPSTLFALAGRISRVAGWDPSGLRLAAFARDEDGEGGGLVLLDRGGEGAPLEVVRFRSSAPGDLQEEPGSVAFSSDGRYVFFVLDGGLWWFDRHQGTSEQILPVPWAPPPSGPLAWTP